MKVNKNIGVGKNKPYNQNSLHFPDGIDSEGTAPAPPSGGDGSGSNWRYFKLADGWEDNPTATQLLPGFMQLINYVDSENNIISSGGILWFMNAPKETIKKIAFDANVKISLQNQFYTWSEFLAGSGMSENEVITMLNMTEITKEQFYSLD